ncbi:hypothetical protein ACFQZE_07675 [Paenibacillus sp. GCM10027627]|uniref:hypothetical protein n=1 Tax=unclassified Paenibacillus TaxID=185978 RepID=UPI00362812E9
MRKIFKFGVVIVFLLSSMNISVASATTNLIQNGGFESYTGGGTGNFWSFGTIGNTPQSFYADVTPSDAAEGVNAQRLREDGVSLAGDTLRIISDKYSVTATQNLALSFKTNVTSMVESYLKYSLVFYDSSGNIISEADGTNVTAATNGYVLKSFDATPPSNAATFSVKFDSVISLNGGYYQLYLDDVSVIVTSSNNSVSNSTQVGVVGGNLEFSVSPSSFLSVDLDNNAVMQTTAASTSVVTDNTGGARGWSVKMSATDFTSQPLADPSSGGAATFVLKIPASFVSVNVGTISHTAGQPIHATHGPIARAITLSSATQTFVSANPGFGSGSYSVPLSYTLTIPKTLEITSQTGTGSKFAVGDFVGTRSGQYFATINFTIGTGL